MKINGKPFWHFGMKANDFSYQPMSISSQAVIPVNGAVPVSAGFTFAAKTMDLTAEFRNKKEISNFIAELAAHDVNLIDIDDGFLYRCFYQGNSSAEEIWGDLYRVTFSFYAVQCGHWQSVSVKDGTVLFCQGNYPADCRFRIKPKVSVSEASLNDMVIRSLIPGREVVIDGLAKTVKEELDNKFEDCDLIDFPQLMPGKNKIKTSLTPAQADLVCEYYPVWI